MFNENLLDTSMFLSKSCNVRSCMKTSASSNNVTPFHLVANVNTSASRVLKSPELILINGRRVRSAMLSRGRLVP